MDKILWFDNLSLTHLRQELSIVNAVLVQLQYSEVESEIKASLSIFESKTLRDFSNEELLKKVLEVLTKLKRISVVNSFGNSYLNNKSFVLIGLSDKGQCLQNYKKELNKEIEKKQIDEGLLKRHSWFRMDERNTSFFLELQDGSVVPIPFTERANGNRMFWVFRILYEKWISSPSEPAISKSEIKMELKKYDKNYDDNAIKDAITKLRMTKLRGTQLEKYIGINFDKNINKYHLSISRVL